MVLLRWARRSRAVRLSVAGPEVPRGPCAGRHGSGVRGRRGVRGVRGGRGVRWAVAGRASSLGMVSLGLGFWSPMLFSRRL